MREVGKVLGLSADTVAALATFVVSGSAPALAQGANGDLSSYSFHMADQGTDAMEREKAFLMASKEGRFLWHLNQALRRGLAAQAPVVGAPTFVVEPHDSRLRAGIDPGKLDQLLDQLLSLPADESDVAVGETEAPDTS